MKRKNVKMERDFPQQSTPQLKIFDPNRMSADESNLMSGQSFQRTNTECQ